MKAKNIGIVGKKLGMSQIYVDGKLTGVTVVDYSDLKVIGKRTLEKDGYVAAILGYDFKNVLKKGEKLSSPRIIREFKVADLSVYDGMDESLAQLKKVDVSGIMKGRGFAGAIKRHGFSGGPATHGSKTHRRVGSIGQCSSPSKVFKGKKMPGHYGNVKITQLSQKLVKVDSEKKLLFIAGSIPGSNNAYVLVRDSIKG